MTPYTSLLVLETDEDRERFGVKRRFQMRDGERFFAEGRSKASFELLQKQMKAAGNWRLELRQQALRELALLGRVRYGNRQGRPAFNDSVPTVIMYNGQSRSLSGFDGYRYDAPMSAGKKELDELVTRFGSLIDEEFASDEGRLLFADLPTSNFGPMEKSQRQQLSLGPVYSLDPLAESNSSWSSELRAERQNVSMFGAGGQVLMGGYLSTGQASAEGPLAVVVTTTITTTIRTGLTNWLQRWQKHLQHLLNRS